MHSTEAVPGVSGTAVYLCKALCQHKFRCRSRVLELHSSLHQAVVGYPTEMEHSWSLCLEHSLTNAMLCSASKLCCLQCLGPVGISVEQMLGNTYSYDLEDGATTVIF